MARAMPGSNFRAATYSLQLILLRELPVTKSSAQDTPMMRQYWEAKAASQDAILLFRMGDFYELFHEDAKTAARVLGLTLTSRDKGEDPTPMAGFPYHQLEGYLAKLLQLGYRAAVCDQVEDPKFAKGLVKREITRVVSAGTVTDEELLEPSRANYLVALLAQEEPPTGKSHGEERTGGAKPAEQRLGLAWVELSTGQFMAGEFPLSRLHDELARIDPAECLLPEGFNPFLNRQEERPAKTVRPAWLFGATQTYQALCQHFGTQSLEGFGFDRPGSLAVRAAGAILLYLQETHKQALPQIERLVPYDPGRTLQMDESTRRSLEILRTQREGKREGSLLAAVDRTVTAAGARLLAEWLAQPLTDVARIDARLSAVAELAADPRLNTSLQDQLKQVFDLERLLTRVVTQRASPRDLSALCKTLAILPGLKARLAGRRAPLLDKLERELDLCPEIRRSLESALGEQCPLSPREGGFIRDGYSPRLDELRELAAGGKQWIARYQAQESQATGISSLKVGFNKVFGYYLEVTHLHADKVPPHYQRKQTLTNAERYITPELKTYEEQVLNADEESRQLEYELFVKLRDQAAEFARRIAATARVLAALDVLTGFARLATERGYCRPVVVEQALLTIKGGRHPVLEGLLPPGKFVPNDTECHVDAGRVLLITGPNMAGKSTYIRQVALLCILAQTGSFVPAQAATIGLCDRVFARVGASDELARGQSTFMVEMTETARILNLATANSLVILDEIGRGTSTYDGLSLAWSIVEYLHDAIRARTLFATHYHELTELAKQKTGVRNLTVAVREWLGKIAFLHQIIPGTADKSYGIHVARLAGIPAEVSARAEVLLAQLEAQVALARQATTPGAHAAHDRSQGGSFGGKTADSLGLSGESAAAEIGSLIIRPPVTRTGQRQLMFFEPDHHPAVEMLRSLRPDSLTPLEALQMLHQLKKECG